MMKGSVFLDGGSVLCAQNIHKSFHGTKALNGVSIDLKKGEIHALVGENGAGKSTLMNILSGVFQQDEGNISLDGVKLNLKNPDDAQKAGIGLVHQELALCPDVTVAENIFIGRLPQKGGVIQRKKLHDMTREVLKPFHIIINPDQVISELSVAQQQIVEIAKVLSLKCKVVIFDEPTSSLNEAEAQSLMKIIEDIRSKGIGVFYISHKLSEIFQISDRITVLRDGNHISTVNAKEVDSDYIVSDMVGKKINDLYPPKAGHNKNREEILKIENFTRFPDFNNVSFSIYKGEILGLCGLVGAGRTEVARAICGIDKSKNGHLSINEESITVNNYSAALKLGICYLSEERKKDGLFLSMSLLENMMAPELDLVSKYGIIQRKIVSDQIDKYKNKINIKFFSVHQSISNLSGGNQQKIMIAKLLALNPKLIIMDEPTRGIDVGAKSEIHQILRELSNSGVGVILISSEMPEVVGMCDRVIVMNVGNVVGELENENVTQGNIIKKISEFNKQ